ncbi:N-acetyltransferase [Halobacteriovorax vibrionivorans]|uniref:N-acetyltransferase n=1 Tax=Halobacteriovorax vibrionivorans TaxID=2152716 RepID=A0ABY0IGF9_9BACT|nr:MULTISPECIES: N-acetyltransferase [Halobacteriovorax]RZF20437.1 N-acetyltransferase [Halobacteriovorax vibrionivorans]TGD46610.1 N-acetyltransferase [Halobacteriovorax sp. Y22]
MKIQFEYLAKLDEQMVDKLSDFESDHFKWSWSKKVWKELAGSSRNIVCLWQESLENNKKEIISLCVFELSSPDFCHLYKIVVDEKFRRRKLALALFKQMCHVASVELGFSKPHIYLEVEENNDGAIGFYQKMGLKQIHIKKRFYQNGNSAVIMHGVQDCDKP